MPSNTPKFQASNLLTLSTLFIKAIAQLQCSNRVPDLPQPKINDCRYIIPHLPSLRVRPEELIRHGSLTLTLGPLRSEPFELPAKIRHGTCWISAHAYMIGNTYSDAPLTQKSEYYHVWTEVRERATNAISLCIGRGFSFASHIEDYDLPGSGPIGLAMTVGRLPEPFEYTFLAGTTIAHVI